MAATTGSLIQLLLILFAFDVVRKIYFKPKELNSNLNNNNNKITKKSNHIEKNSKKEILNENQQKYNIYEDDDEFVISKNSEKNNEKKEDVVQEDKNIIDKKEKKKKILIINYDKYLYKKNFFQLKNEIENNYTNVVVKGEEYPLPENKKFFSKFTYITQIGVSLLLIFTKALKQGLPFLSDNTIKIIDYYKWPIMLCNFFIHFWLNRYLGTTGAFEIIYKNKLIYSKLETHSLPNHIDLKKIIKNLHMKSNDEEDF